MRLYFIFALLTSISMEACDICGCYMGLTPYQNFSSVGLYYRYRSFNGYSQFNQKHKAFPSTVFRTTHGGLHELSEEDSENDYELYRIAELRGKFFLHPRWETSILLPYFFNSSRISGERTVFKGFGDMNILTGFHLIPLTDDPVFKQRLIVGAGAKLGTGKYQIADSNNIRLNPLLQPGTGTVDGLFYTNYYLQWREFGVLLNTLYKVNSTNLYQERFGNSITNYLNVLWRIELGNFQLIPMFQTYHEYTRGLIKKGELLEGTEMNEVLMGPGLDFYYKGLLLNTGIQWTVQSSVPSYEMGSASRMILGISYNFLQNKYLVAPKQKAL